MSLAILLLACSDTTAPEVAPSPDQGEGARARSEEGKVGRKDAKAVSARQQELEANRALLKEIVGTTDSKPVESTESAGLLGGADVGVVGGAGGLGSRGTGIGGGGTATGLGGIGTKGMGSGKSGYGRGGSLSQGLIRPEPSRSHFTDYGTNAHTLTAEDAQSTFSIDVDTASFAVARSYLDRNTLPPPSAVRVEEFVNAQSYSYTPPSNDAPFAVNMEAAPDPFRAGRTILRVGVKAREQTLDRPPVNLTFLVDVSGSMQAPNKLPLAKRSLHYLVDNLHAEDRVALVTYAGSTGVVIPPTPMSNRARVHAAIDGLTNGGGTAMASGMTLAYDLALETMKPGTENRVIVLSDGDANIGASSHEQILEQLSGYAKKGITLSTIGLGRGNYQDTLMEQLANKGDGNYYYIDAFPEAKKVFGTQLASTLQTVARDVKIQVEFEPDAVLSYRLLGYENRDIADKDFRNDAVDAGEIGSGHAVTTLYELILRDEPGDTLATVRMRSKPPGPDAPAIERATTLPTQAVRDEFPSATRDFRIAYATASFAELLRDSPHAEELSYDQVAKLARAARRNSDDDALIGLMDKAGTTDGALAQR